MQNQNPKTQTLNELLQYVEELLSHTQVQEALRVCEKLLKEYPNHIEVIFLKAVALQLDGSLKEALKVLQQAALGDNESTDIWCHIGLTALELLDISLSQKAIVNSLNYDPFNPDAWWVRSLLRECKGDRLGAYRTYLHAQWLDPQTYPPLPILNALDIENILHEALQHLPVSLKEYYASLTVYPQDAPSLALLQRIELSPLHILCFVDRNQARLNIYTQNLKRFIQTGEDVSSALGRELLIHSKDYQFNMAEA
ncbi:MAG: tetratricopeptide repeat protein [Myxococcota bacterium]|nr:tetratricopeptide repeat protein [Myxococcota bacterium]